MVRMAEQNYSAALELLGRAHAQHANPRFLYLQACCQALMGDVVEALAGLEGALAAGYRDAEEMVGDERLAAVRDEEQFRSLVDRMLTARAEEPASEESVPAAGQAPDFCPRHFHDVPLNQVLPALAAAADTIGPQIVSAIANVNPMLAPSIQVWLDMFRNSIAGATGPETAAAAPALAPAPTPAAPDPLEDALARLQLQEEQAGPSSVAPAMEVDEPIAEPAEPAMEAEPQVLTPEPSAPPANTTSATEAVDEDKLFKLQELGFFDRERNRQALEASGGSLTVAVNRLLSGCC